MINDGDVVLAIENWNNDYNVFSPNGWPKNWLIDGIKTIPPLEGRDWFAQLPGDATLTDTELMRIRKSGKTMFLSNYKDQFKHILLGEVPDGHQYLYPIEINRPGSIVDDINLTDFKYVSETVKQHVREGRAKIVLLMPYEGDYPAEVFNVLHSWCTNCNFPKDGVYFINANIKSVELTKDLNFSVKVLPTIFTSMFPLYRTNYDENIYTSECTFTPTSKLTNLYVCYNRRPRHHRLIMLCSLLKHKIWHRGLISYRPDNFDVNFDESFAGTVNKELHNYIKMLQAIGPKELDMDLQDNNPAIQYNIDHYSQTFLSLIPETGFSNHSVFFSEKIWKSIRIGHPFIVIGNPGMLQELHNLGFKTFNDYWDESYDNVSNLEERVNKITSILVKLSKLSTLELHGLRADMKETIEFNQNLINSFGLGRSMDTIATTVKQIYDTFLPRN
jgi:hypothetical protein